MAEFTFKKNMQGLLDNSAEIKRRIRALWKHVGNEQKKINASLIKQFGLSYILSRKFNGSRYKMMKYISVTIETRKYLPTEKDKIACLRAIPQSFSPPKKPHEISHRDILKHCGNSIFCHWRDRYEALRAAFGTKVSLLDMNPVPRGTWQDEDRIRTAVREAVNRLNMGDRVQDIRYDNLVAVGLESLFTDYPITKAEALRIAGYDVDDPVCWMDKKHRVKRIKELYEEMGGLMNITWNSFVEEEPGLTFYYIRERQKNKKLKRLPYLYIMLKEAGYDVAVKECQRGVVKNKYVKSGHGHYNSSRGQAMLDDVIYEIVGGNHLHSVEYPGQDNASTRKLNCDFILFSKNASPVDVESWKLNVGSSTTPLKAKGLWCEYAGLDDGKGWLRKKYQKKLRRKKRLARKMGITLVCVKPGELDPIKDVLRMKLTEIYADHIKK